MTDGGGVIVAANRAFCQLSGYSAEELLGGAPNLLRSERHDPHFFELMWSDLKATAQWSGDIWNRHRSGRLFVANVAINGVVNEEGDVTHYVAIYTDVTAKHRETELMTRSHNSDPSTGLPNREILLDRLDRVCARNRRNSFLACLMFIDVEGLKAVNERFGFDAGDEVLREMTRRLKICLRDNDTVAKLDRGQFAVLLPEVTSHEGATLVADKLVTLLSDTYRFGLSHRAYMSVSIGAAMLPADGRVEPELMRCADMALRHSKAEGTNLFRFYSAEPS